MSVTQIKKKYLAYPKYKPSGIDWLGDIPEDWKIKRLKYYFNYHVSGIWGDEENGDENDMICIRVADFYFDRLGINTNNLTIRNIPVNQHSRILLKGDILLEKSGGGEKQPVGRAVRFNLDMKSVCSNFIERLIPFNINESKYISYLLGTMYFETINTRSIKQTTGIQNLDLYLYFCEFVPFPSIETKQLIASFLDKENKKIDLLIEKKQKLIELLKEKRAELINQAVTKGLNPNTKLKQSGIAWLGDIPEKWEIKKLKYISTTRVSNVDKKSEDEINIKLCNYIDVYKNEIIQDNIEFMRATATIAQVDKFNLRNNDVLITKDSETSDDIGIPAYVLLSSTKDIVCGYHLAQITTNESLLLGKYLFRLFQSMNYKNYFDISSNGVTRFGLKTYAIINIPILLPKIVDQQQIVGFLDSETEKIGRAIEKIQQQIEFIKEYRMALITNAVTGKIMIN